MFVDEVTIDIIAGTGGNGCNAFRREKNVPLGGPSGGNGGKGGDIVFVADEGLSTLLDLRYQKLIKGKRGAHGEGKNMHGKNAADTIIKVPVGTVVYNETDQSIIADLTMHNQKAVIARGGRGGRGNVAFRTHANPAPSYCENGEPGEEVKAKVELKLLADVGLVGLPSVGKSTFLSVVTHSKPKIADYHFTTLHPNLGVVKNANGSFVIADLPGLIKGASLGEGLGTEFLKHIERTKVIAHIIDMGASEGRDPVSDYQLILAELKSFDESLLTRPSIIIANKMDLPNASDNLKLFEKAYPDLKIFPVSAITKQGLEPVLNQLQQIVLNEKYHHVKQPENTHKLYKFEDQEPFVIHHEDNAWIVTGDEIEKITIMTNFSTDEAMRRFSQKVKALGIDNKLAELGAQDGDTIRIYDLEFEYKRG